MVISYIARSLICRDSIVSSWDNYKFSSTHLTAPPLSSASLNIALACITFPCKFCRRIRYHLGQLILIGIYRHPNPLTYTHSSTHNPSAARPLACPQEFSFRIEGNTQIYLRLRSCSVFPNSSARSAQLLTSVLPHQQSY